MNQQVAYLNQLKQTMELYQFMIKLCWLKTLLEAQVSEKRTSGSEKNETEVYQAKPACKSLTHQEKSKVSTIVASEVIKGRMYDFNNGRFLSVDPFIQGTTSQAINPYSYIQNNPLSGVDPTGYATCPVDGPVSCLNQQGSHEIIDADGNELGVYSKNEDGAGQFTVTTTKGFRFANDNGIELQGTNNDVAFKDDVSDLGSYIQNEYDARLDFAGNAKTVPQDNRSTSQVFGDAYKELGPGGLAADCASRECSSFEKAMASLDFIPGIGKAVAKAGLFILPFVKKADDLDKLNLNKKLASDEQVAELRQGSGEAIFGAGTGRALRDQQRLAETYGGDPKDWAKVRSSNRKHPDGFNQETHAYQNVKTGEVVEFKTKVQGH